ncbi:acyltransferase family protein [Granulicella sp. 5B5]|uniref:acyltransferase family protein n=1 Tax=Granulicella sp. 5B5 TaxID=1617967 RepID=UPI0015F40F05|nr:acyltransferase [Granulicella sp. 5B5]QMV18279.1 acyltransferase family protein [Granulicella sp. 5B5]
MEPAEPSVQGPSSGLPQLRIEREKHGKHIPALDGLRGLAILMVLGMHLGGGRHSSFLLIRIIAGAIRIGWSGVTLFFVLSGFLISGILWDSFQKAGWWKRFYYRRSLRIFPLYYLCLIYAALLILVFRPGVLHDLTIFVFYLQDFPWFYKATSQLHLPLLSIDHFWSLAVEEQFYLVWPFFLFALRKHRKAAIVASLLVVLASLGFRLTMLGIHADQHWVYNAPMGRAGELAMGAALALILRGPPHEQAQLYRLIPAGLTLASISLLALTIATRGSFETTQDLWLGWGILCLALAFTCVLALCLRPGPLQRLFENRLLRWYGRISYGVYVFHPLVAAACAWLIQMYFSSHEASTALEAFNSVVVIAGTTLLAFISFYTYESYFLRLKDGLPTANRTAEVLG